jgi:tRNA(fMet)-specific endonuclease VapC
LIYFIDSNIAAALMNDRPHSVRQRLRRATTGGGSVAVSTIVTSELWYGVARSQRRAENAARLKSFLAGAIEVVPFGEEDAALAGELRATLRSRGTPVGPYDVLIAAQALRAGGTMVTANTREFRRIHGLIVQDWTRA